MYTVLLTDFPDVLSPMVVKELRQGMRTRLFAGVLLVLHALMLLITLISGAAEDAGDVDGLRVSLMVLVLCMILPLRGFSSLAGEIQRNTMDMLVLTRLSAWKIVLGKWASLAAQLTLVAVSLLPYVVARYLYGAQDLMADLLVLGLLWLIGLAVTAAVVCLSTQKAFWLRAAVVVLFGIAPLFFGAIFAVSSAFGGGGVTTGFSAVFAGGGVFSGSTLWVVLAVLLTAAWAIFTFLSLAATRVAPPSENLAVIKRSLHGGVILILVGLSFWGWIGVGTVEIVAVAFGVLYFASLDALTERNPEVTSIYTPFYRQGWLGRGMALFLVPGWRTGVVFSFVMAGLLVCRLALESGFGSPDAYLGLFHLAEVWMISALVLISSGRRSRDLLGPWIVIYLIMTVVQILVSLVSMQAAVFGDQTPWGFCLLPGLVPSGYPAAQPEDQDVFLALGAGLSAIWPIFLTVAAAIAWVKSREIRREAKAVAAAAVRSRSAPPHSE